MEDLKDIVVGKNFKWEGNLEEDDNSKVRVYFKVINSEYFNEKYNIFVEVDKIAAKNEGYYTHINSFCNSGKDAINDREYLQMIAGIISVIKEQFSQFGDYSINVKSLNCSDIPQNITESKKEAFGTSNASYLNICNMTSRLLSINVSQIDNYDWDGDSRPDHNFNNVIIN